MHGTCGKMMRVSAEGHACNSLCVELYAHPRRFIHWSPRPIALQGALLAAALVLVLSRHALADAASAVDQAVQMR